MELSDKPVPDALWFRLTAPTLLVIAGFVGGVCGLLTSGYMRTDTAGIGIWGLLSAPVHLGILAAVIRPDIPGRLSLAMSVVCVLAAAPIMEEGAVCLVVIAPWVVVLTPLIALLAGWGLRRLGWDGARGIALLSALVLPVSMTWADVELRRDMPEEILVFEDSVVVDAPRTAVWASIERLELDLDKGAPWVVRALLPRPIAILGGGAHPGAERRVVFSNGTVVATVTAAEAPSRFDIDLRVEDAGVEFFDHWTNLRDSTFELEELPGGKTRVVHRTRYEALCFPRWYFAPVEEYFGRKLQAHLLEAYADQFFPVPPRDERLPVASR